MIPSRSMLPRLALTKALHASLDQQRAAMTRYTDDSSNFGADGPFFRVIREGLKGLVDGDDYFDLLADDVISVPGYPRRLRGRQSIIDLYSDYDSYMRVHSADNLRVYRDPEASVVVLEYEVHGESVKTGRPGDEVSEADSLVITNNKSVTTIACVYDPASKAG